MEGEDLSSMLYKFLSGKKKDYRPKEDTKGCQQ